MAARTSRLVLALRGRQRVAAPGLPIGEAMHPVVLGALVVLACNDWWWKPGALGRVAPALTGKLSDVAGLIAAPLVLSALIGLALRGLGARNPTLSRRRLACSIAATATVFIAVKASAAVAVIVADGWARLAPGARIVADPTDLWCLPALGIAWWIGRGELARVPLGRVAVVLRRDGTLDDVVASGAAPADVAALTTALEAGDAAAADAALAKLEG